MQQVIGLIACPGSGKSTYTQTFDPSLWVTINLDSIRQALWPPHRRVYWDVRQTIRGDDAQTLLHNVHRNMMIGALENGFSVISDDTNTEEKYSSVVTHIAEMFGLGVFWKVFDVPLEILIQRNNNRGEDMRVPEHVIIDKFEKMWVNDAWWRSEQNVEIIHYNSFDIKSEDTPEQTLEKLIKTFPRAAQRAVKDVSHRQMFVNKIYEHMEKANTYTDMVCIIKLVDEYFDK